MVFVVQQAKLLFWCLVQVLATLLLIQPPATGLDAWAAVIHMGDLDGVVASQIQHDLMLALGIWGVKQQMEILFVFLFSNK